MNTEKSGLISLEEAAAYLGLQPRTLYKLLDRSRLRLKGIPVQGPTIRFFQARPRGAIYFRREWLDAYIAAGTHKPEAVPLVTKTAPAVMAAAAEPTVPVPASRTRFGFIPELWEP
jgi:hypothetical protein